MSGIIALRAKESPAHGRSRVATKVWQGMNWVRQEKRAALYERDGRRCLQCGRGTNDGVTLTLDHLVPRSVCTAVAELDPKTEIVVDGEITVFAGKPNESHNLVTMCGDCNSSRGATPWTEFYNADAQVRVRSAIRTEIDLALGKRIIASLAGSPIESAR